MAKDDKHAKGPVVLVDADEGSQKEASAVLKEIGYEVNICPSAARATRLVESKPPRLWIPTLIIVDTILPDTSGFELTRRLSDKYGEKKIPIIMMSRYSSPEDELEAVSAGALGLMKKPVTQEGIDHFLEDLRMKELKTEIGQMLFDINYD